jgi:hypothetical protein
MAIAMAMANGRCRMHGGQCTGPRTPEGLARLAAARTKHGHHCAASRAMHRYQRTVVIRIRLFCAAQQLRPYLPSEMEARMALRAKELFPPPHPSHGPVATDADKILCNVERAKAGRDARGRFAARPRPALRGQMAERDATRAEAAMQAPWRAGIAQTRMACRAAFRAQLSVRPATRGQDAMMRLPPDVCPSDGTVRSDGADAEEGPVPGIRQGGTLGQGARSAEREQDPMKRGTVGTDVVDCAVGPAPGLHQGGTPGQGARSAEREQDPVKRGTVRLERVDAGGWRSAVWRGPVPVGLLGSTAGNDQAVHKLGAQLKGAGG